MLPQDVCNKVNATVLTVDSVNPPTLTDRPSKVWYAYVSMETSGTVRGKVDCATFQSMPLTMSSAKIVTSSRWWGICGMGGL